MSSGVAGVLEWCDRSGQQPKGWQSGQQNQYFKWKNTDLMPLRFHNLLGQMKEYSVAGCDFRTVRHFCLGAPLF